MRVSTIKLLLVISLLSPSARAANVTQAQVKDVQVKAVDIQQKAFQLLRYANYANSLFDDNFQVSVAFSTTTVAVPTNLKNELINVTYYQSLKAQLQAAIDALP